MRPKIAQPLDRLISFDKKPPQSLSQGLCSDTIDRNLDWAMFTLQAKQANQRDCMKGDDIAFVELVPLGHDNLKSQILTLTQSELSR
jgi:hypothetical protein